jgi:uncharacterized LabA/DUF88 family protein
MSMRSFSVLESQSSGGALSLSSVLVLNDNVRSIGALILFGFSGIFSRTFSCMPAQWRPFINLDEWDSDENKLCNHVNILIDTSTSTLAGMICDHNMPESDFKHRCRALCLNLKAQEGSAKVRTLLTSARVRKRLAEHVMIAENTSQRMANIKEWITAQLVDAEVFSHHGRREVMSKYDVIQIVDAYQHVHATQCHTMKNDPDGEAQGLSMLVKLLGRNTRKIAIVSQDDDPRLLAYGREDYEIIKMNGDRDVELRKFIHQMTSQIENDKPKHTVLVSDDPEFVYLCEATAKHTDLAVWANSRTVPKELAAPSYNFRPLEELLPSLKIPRIDVRLDLENIFIGLVQRSWRPNLADLLDAVRHSMEDLGEIVSITGYADWSKLARHHGGPGVDWQHEFVLAGGDSRYVLNQHRKNTADMRIADDVRTLVEHNSGAPSVVDVICLATMDRDFRPVVETAQRRGKRVVVLGLEGGVSRELETVANEVRYLDKYLHLAEPNEGAEAAAPTQCEDASLMMPIAKWTHSNYWRSVYSDRLKHEFVSTAEGVRGQIADGWLVPWPHVPAEARGQSYLCGAHYYSAIGGMGNA